MPVRMVQKVDCSADDLLRRSLHEIGAMALDDAEQSLRSAVAQFPDDGRFWELLGTVLWCDGDQDEALAALETASAYRALAPFSQIILADCYVRLNKPNLAFMILYFLTEEDRCPTQLLPQLARALGSIRAYYLAAKVCEQLVERMPAHHGAYFGMAYYYQKEGHTVECVLRYLARAFELQPGCLNYRINYGIALAQLGMDCEATSLLNQVHPQTIRCVGWLSQLSKLYRRLGDTIRSELFESRILELS